MKKYNKLPFHKTISPLWGAVLAVYAVAVLLGQIPAPADVEGYTVLIFFLPLILLLHVTRWMFARTKGIYYQLVFSRIAPAQVFTKRWSIMNLHSKREFALVKQFGLSPPRGASQTVVWLAWYFGIVLLYPIMWAIYLAIW